MPYKNLPLFIYSFNISVLSFEPYNNTKMLYKIIDIVAWAVVFLPMPSIMSTSIMKFNNIRLSITLSLP